MADFNWAGPVISLGTTVMGFILGKAWESHRQKKELLRSSYTELLRCNECFRDIIDGGNEQSIDDCKQQLDTFFYTYNTADTEEITNAVEAAKNTSNYLKYMKTNFPRGNAVESGLSAQELELRKCRYALAKKAGIVTNGAL